MSISHAAGNGLAEDLAYQDQSLQGVSRTFALTIPQLPEDLRPVIGNAYLLCRIADTIEDSEVLTMDEKRAFYSAFVSVAAGEREVETFGDDVAARVGASTLDAEVDLLRNIARVIRITRSFTDAQQAALARCVRIMSEGMEEFQQGNFANGLRDMAHMDAYCYHVAGVVGEMLTDLFCAHSPELEARRAELSARSVSFGQGLQMTNILKDIWDDKERDMCWLPRSVFETEGFDLDRLPEGYNDPKFQAGVEKLVATARGHLENALDYALIVPTSETGIRNFCLWAIGMAIMTLRNVHRRPGFHDGTAVKITRRDVRRTILATRFLGRSDALLRWAFNWAGRGVPSTPIPVSSPSIG